MVPTVRSARTGSAGVETQADCGNHFTIFVCGCAAARASRKGYNKARAGDWDGAVAEYTKAVQENPDHAEYKIALERATQTAAREHIGRAHELEQKDQLDLALIEYRRALELDASNRLAAAKATELEKVIPSSIKPTALIVWPQCQKPHWNPSCAMKAAWTG